MLLLLVVLLLLLVEVDVGVEVADVVAEGAFEVGSEGSVGGGGGGGAPVVK